MQKPARGEHEITDIIRRDVGASFLLIEQVERDYAWLDTDMRVGLLGTSKYVRTIQTRQKILIACFEEIADMQGFIIREQAETRRDIGQDGRLSCHPGSGRRAMPRSASALAC